MKKLLENTMVIISIALILWMGASWCEICLKNTNENPEYSDHNFWVNALELYEEKGVER